MRNMREIMGSEIWEAQHEVLRLSKHCCFRPDNEELKQRYLKAKERLQKLREEKYRNKKNK